MVAKEGCPAARFYKLMSPRLKSKQMAMLRSAAIKKDTLKQSQQRNIDDKWIADFTQRVNESRLSISMAQAMGIKEVTKKATKENKESLWSRLARCLKRSWSK